MSKPKFKHIWIELYHVDLYWVVCERGRYEQLIKDEFGVDAPEGGKNSDARFEVHSKEGREIGVLWFNTKNAEKPNMEIIAHEAFHAAHWILQKQGLWLTDSSEEAYAYLIQFIVKKIKC
jgi:hypothetical protein